MKNLKFAVLGTGYWSTLQIPAWFEVGGVDLVAVYNRTISKAEKIAEKYDIAKVYNDPEEMLNIEELDFIDIIAQVPAHAPFVQLAAKYKVPVVCQKPMAEDYQTCNSMVLECKEAGIPFFIHENFRWQPPMRAVKKALDAGYIGNPFRANIQLYNYRAEEFGFNEQPFIKELDHYALTDIGSHLFDLARFFFGEPHSIYCQTYKTVDYIGGEDVVSALLRINNVMCHCEISNRCNTTVYIEGTNGIIELDMNSNLHIVTDKDTIIKDCNELSPQYSWVSPEDQVYNGAAMIHSIVSCNAHLLKALKTGRNPETTGEDNLRTMRLMFCAIESADKDKLIFLDKSPLIS
jgi:predicted dehydrogenase